MSYSPIQWDPDEFLGPGLDILENPESDHQLHMDFIESESLWIEGIEYKVSTEFLPVANPMPEPKKSGWVAYKFSYSVPSPGLYFELESKSVQLKAKSPKKLHLSPHSKFTKEVLRRPNKYGK